MNRKVETIGSLQAAHCGGQPKTVSNDENDFIVTKFFIENPTFSQCRAVAQLDISRTGLPKSLKKTYIKPFRPRLVQALKEDDFDRRIQFCEEFLIRTPTFVSRILWTDETSFKLNVMIKLHNFVYWDFDNPPHHGKSRIKRTRSFFLG